MRFERQRKRHGIDDEPRDRQARRRLRRGGQNEMEDIDDDFVVIEESANDTLASEAGVRDDEMSSTPRPEVSAEVEQIAPETIAAEPPIQTELESESVENYILEDLPFVAQPFTEDTLDFIRTIPLERVHDKLDLPPLTLKAFAETGIDGTVIPTDEGPRVILRMSTPNPDGGEDEIEVLLTHTQAVHYLQFLAEKQMSEGVVAGGINSQEEPATEPSLDSKDDVDTGIATEDGLVEDMRSIPPVESEPATLVASSEDIIEGSNIDALYREATGREVVDELQVQPTAALDETLQSPQETLKAASHKLDSDTIANPATILEQHQKVQDVLTPKQPEVNVTSPESPKVSTNEVALSDAEFLKKAYADEVYASPEFNERFPKFAEELAGRGGDRAAALGLILEYAERAREQETKERHSKFSKIAERFSEEYGISEEELSALEGLELLSEPQQKMLFENFTQLTLGNVREEAARLTENTFAERREAAVAKLGGLLGRAVSGVREAVTKTKVSIDNEQAVAERVRTGGFAEHKDLLQQLVSGFVANGPQITEKNGELIVEFVTVPDTLSGEKRGEVTQVASALNEAANAFARLSTGEQSTLGVDDVKESSGLAARFSRWLVTDKKERSQQDRFREAEIAYETAKEKFARALREQGVSDIAITKQLLAVDTRVTQQQMVMTDERAIAALDEIKDKNFWKEIGHSMVQGPGLYMFLGFAGRTSLSAGIGFFGAPLASAGIASLRSWNKSAALLRERDRKVRAGIKDDASGALNVVTSESLVSKTSRLIEQVGKAASEEEKQKALNSLRVRVEYIQDKMLLSRVSYGGRDEVVRSQTALATTLAEAMTLLVSQEQNFQSTMTERYLRLTGKLERKLDKKEQTILEEREAARLQDLTKSAYTAALFSIAGASVAALNDDMVESTAGTTSAVAEVVPAAAEAEVKEYVVVPGDTLTTIFKEQVLAAETGVKNSEVQQFLKSLTPAELEKVGLRSGNIDRIFAGEKINTTALHELWEAKQKLDIDVSQVSMPNNSEVAIADNLTRDGEIKVTVEDVVSNEGANMVAGQSSDSDSEDVDFERQGDNEYAEAPKVVPEVAADVVTKIRARDISNFLVERYHIAPDDWDALRSVRVSDVVAMVKLKDSWFDILGTNTIPDIGLAVRNLDTIIQEAARPGVDLKPNPGETVENFMRRLATTLAANQNTGELPLFLRTAMEDFNKITGAKTI